MRFTTAQDESLVDKVGEFPPLYNKEHKLNKNVVLKNNLWADVSKHVGRDVNECKRRWRDIKDNYFKIVRHINRAPESGSRRPLKWHLFDRLSFLKKPPGGPESENDYNGWEFTAETVGDDALTEGAATLALACDVQLKSEQSPYGADDSYGDDSSLYSVSEATDSKTANKRKFTDGLASRVVDDEDDDESRVKRIKSSSSVKIVERNYDRVDDVDLFMRSIALSVKKLPDFMIAKAKENILKVVNDLQFPCT